MAFGTLVFSIILWIFGLFILYIVISTAVKDGINKSVVGEFIKKEYEIEEDKKSLLDSDLDNNK
ncbi:hypothetical protein [Bacillus benzoevorans]|uniref:Uncharacterized protein n=1 Tax=Bacillus benzoevorans TaxID=1456 RepID=A0A7X0LVH2_9BACI|nr:hypothetical protein [Bacillus benzoevorans]MBB6445618.1 hypothetical protein [Bacillus benzoevorans]